MCGRTSLGYDCITCFRLFSDTESAGALMATADGRSTPSYFTCLIGEHLVSLSPNNDLQEKPDARMCDNPWGSTSDQ